MNEQAIYYFLMFFAGAILARLTFYFQNKSLEKNTIQLLSALVISIFEFLYKINKTYIQDRTTFYSEVNTWDDSQKSKYLNLEERHLEQQMAVVTILLVSTFKKKFRKNLLFKDWTDVKRILRAAEEIIDEKDKG